MTAAFVKRPGNGEVTTLQALGPRGHPGLVPLLGLHEDGTMALAAAHGDAATPAAWPADVGAAEVLEAFGPVAAALAALHAERHLHRDVHPANVLVVDRARPVRLWLSDPGPPGEGHPGFVAPEVLAGRPFSPAADAFGLAATVDAVLDVLGLALGPDEQAALERGLHPRPTLRPAPVALVAALRGEGAGRRRPGLVDLHAPTLPFELWPERVSDGPPAQAALPRRRGRSAVAAAVAVAVAAVAGLGAAALARPGGISGEVLAPAPLQACEAAAAPRLGDVDHLDADVDGDGCPEVVVRTGRGAAAFGPGGAAVAVVDLGGTWLVGDWACRGRPGPAVRDEATGRVRTWATWADAFTGRAAVEVRGPVGEGVAFVVPARAGRCAVVRLAPRPTWPVSAATGGASESTLRGDSTQPQAMLDYDTT